MVICPACQREVFPESNWTEVNYCRGFALLAVIRQRPGHSAWELAKQTGYDYGQVSKGVAKLRSMDLVRTETEEREVGGFRYRYELNPDASPRLEALMEAHQQRVKRAEEKFSWSNT